MRSTLEPQRLAGKRRQDPRPDSVSFTHNRLSGWGMSRAGAARPHRAEPWHRRSAKLILPQRLLLLKVGSDGRAGVVGPYLAWAMVVDFAEGLGGQDKCGLVECATE